LGRKSYALHVGGTWPWRQTLAEVRKDSGGAGGAKGAFGVRTIRMGGGLKTSKERQKVSTGVGKKAVLRKRRKTLI